MQVGKSQKAFYNTAYFKVIREVTWSKVLIRQEARDIFKVQKSIYGLFDYLEKAKFINFIFLHLLLHIGKHNSFLFF